MSTTRFQLLTSTQRRWFAIGLILAILMVANSLYVVLAGHVAQIGQIPTVLPVTYQLMLVMHIVIGILFFAAAALFALSHLQRMYRLRTKWARLTGTLLLTAITFLFVSGFFILTEANSKENAWIFIGHQVAAAGLLAIYLIHRLLSRDPPVSRSAWSGSVAIAAVLSVAWVIHFTETNKIGLPEVSANTQVQKAALPAPATGAPTVIEYDPHSPFRALGDPDPKSPLFPAKTTTATGGYLPTRIITHDDMPDIAAFKAETREKGFAPSYFLGAQSCASCHADIAKQWATSAHRFASFNNPFYRKSVELTRDTVGKKKSQFCGGCHDPAIMLAGNMTKEIDPLTPESQAGLTCLACHAIDKIHDLTGNGNYNIMDSAESPYIFDQAKQGPGKLVHDYVLKAKPVAHKKLMLKPVFRTSEFCLTCHKVNLDVHVNDYRWLRGQNDYDAWHNSGVPHNNPMTWYQPPKTKQCQDCHMPLEAVVEGDVSAKQGKVRSHRFPGVNTALPHIRGDNETIKRIEKFLQDDKLRVDVFAVHREDGTLVMAPNNNKIVLRPGELIQVDVVVRNKGVGHTFPGGTNDSNEGWIDFKASMDGKEIFRNGAVGADKQVDRSAHFYQAVLIDRHSKRIERRNAADIYTTVYANVIGPSTSDIARYQFRVPKNADGKSIALEADLNWRKFNRTFTEFVFEDKTVPDLPITQIAKDSLTLKVGGKAAEGAVASVDPDKEWMRYNDYGIGMFLDADTRTALQAFQVVAKLQPKRFDGWLNQARTYLQDGNLEKAEAMLRKASELGPDQPRIAFFWGNLLERSGRLPEAIQAYRRTLQTYPKSRDTWARLGRTYWLADQIQSSIDAYREVLKIDPENAQAFHQVTLAYKALAAAETDSAKRQKYAFAAEQAELGFQKYKLDDNAQKVTHEYRQKHPDENKMSQAIVIHGRN